MWYYGTYSCGHEGRVNLTGPGKYREYRMKAEFEKLCPECYEKEVEKRREENTAKAKEEAAEMELPALEGTEKQVAWAYTLRSEILHKLMKYIDATEEGAEKAVPNRLLVKKKLKEYDLNINTDEVYSTLQKVLNHLITTKTKASYWIDNRENTILISWLWISDLIIEIKEKEREIEIPKEILDESLLHPQKSKYGGIVKITGDENALLVSYIKNQEFIKLMREHNLSWTGKEWKRKLTSTTGAYADRAAEIGNHLLKMGFTISILDNAARNKAITGNIEPEHERWIILKIVAEKTYLRIFWTNDISDELFKSIRRLPGAKYERKGFLVKLEYCREVCDFARLNDFLISEKAQAAIQEYEAHLKGISVIPGDIRVKETPSRENQLQELLKAPSTIIEDLKD